MKFNKTELDVYHIWVALLYATRFDQTDMIRSCTSELNDYAVVNSTAYQKATEFFYERHEHGYFDKKDNKLCSVSCGVCGSIQLSRPPVSD